MTATYMQGAKGTTGRRIRIGAPGTVQASPGNPRPRAEAVLGAPGGGITTEELVRRSNYWRDNYNPLRGLTIAHLLALFEQAERGAFAEIQLTLRKAEKRFPVLKGFLEKLLSSVEELDGKVRIKEQLPAGATTELAETQRRFLQSRYDLLKNFKTSIAQLVLADLRGYAVLQKHRYPPGSQGSSSSSSSSSLAAPEHSAGGPSLAAPERSAGGSSLPPVEELYWLEPWCWARDGFYGDFYYNENSQFGVGLGSCQATLGEACRVGSEQLPRTDFVIRESEAPLYEIALIAFVNWLMGRKDYAAFVEIFGLPNAVVILPPNIPPGMEMEYQAAAEKVARGVSGALPAGSDAKFPGQGARGASPYEAFCGAQEKDLVLAGTAGHLTMLALPTGIGKGASEEQDEAWRKIAVAKAMRISDTLQRDFDAPELAAEFPGAPVCVGFVLGIKDAEDVGELLDNVVKVEGAGLRVDAAEISERSGLKLTRAAGGGVANRGQGEGAPGTAQASSEDPQPLAGTVPGAPLLAATGDNHEASRFNSSTH